MMTLFQYKNLSFRDITSVLRRTGFSIFVLLIMMCYFDTISAQAPKWSWAKSYGSSDWEISYGFKVDKSANMYFTGEFSGSTFPLANDTLLTTGGTDFFVSKLDSSGKVLWGRTAVGSS